MPKKPYDVTPTLDGGVMKTIIKNGEGVSTPANGSKVKVHYTGTLTDGTIFDTSKARDPFEFELGKGSVIKAWDIGVATMKKGEVASFECKPEYAYGAAGSPPKIPPNATLIFEIEMISWKAEDLTSKKDGGILRTILHVGEGFSSPNEGSTVDIHVTGEYDGKVFDDRDVIFPLGEGSEHGICDGIEKALEKFKIKEKSKLEIKSKYAFGAAGKTEFNIPPNANVEYTITLNNFEKLKDFWTLSPAEKIEQAEFFKEKGTKYFKEGKYMLAVKIYKKMDDYIGNNVGFGEEETKKQEELNKAMHLNLALCYLKANRNVDARHQCDRVLEKDPENVKALFRRGQSYMNLAEPELAKRDFERVIQIDPKNGAAVKSVQQCNDLLKKQRLQEKKIYANMFEKFARQDTETVYDAKNRDWVYGWWDGKQVKTDKYVPPKTEEEELIERRKERAILLKKLEKKKQEMAKAKEMASTSDELEENTNIDDRVGSSSSSNVEKEEEERKQLPDVMKTLGEWGEDEREREPTKFEKENPNIFMLDGTGDFKNM